MSCLRWEICGKEPRVCSVYIDENYGGAGVERAGCGGSVGWEFV